MHMANGSHCYISQYLCLQNKIQADIKLFLPIFPPQPEIIEELMKVSTTHFQENFNLHGKDFIQKCSIYLI